MIVCVCVWCVFVCVCMCVSVSVCVCALDLFALFALSILDIARSAFTSNLRPENLGAWHVLFCMVLLVMSKETETKTSCQIK